MKPFALAVAVAALALSAPAFADLGGAPILPASSAAAPLSRVAHATLNAATATTGTTPVASASYTVRSDTQPSGTVVREFVATATGEVFAIAWQGPFQPDLRSLMGTTFFERYTQAIQAAHAKGVSMRTQMALTTTDMVVEAHGHVRAFSGLAYVPSLLPAGVTPEQLTSD